MKSKFNLLFQSKMKELLNQQTDKKITYDTILPEEKCNLENCYR